MEKEKILSQLEKRKRAFNLYLENKQKKEEKNISVAHSQKKIREKHFARQERARQLFKREKKIFPEKAYKSFLTWRKMKRKKMKKNENQYAQMQEKLKKIQKMKKYQIDGKKEFDLH